MNHLKHVHVSGKKQSGEIQAPSSYERVIKDLRRSSGRQHQKQRSNKNEYDSKTVTTDEGRGPFKEKIKNKAVRYYSLLSVSFQSGRLSAAGINQRSSQLCPHPSILTHCIQLDLFLLLAASTQNPGAF